MKKLLKSIIILLVVGAIGAGVYALIARKEIKRHDIMLYGNVDIRQVQLAFQSDGRIAVLHVQEGDSVKAGQLVAELDPVRYQDAVDQATAQAAAQKQALAALVAGSRPEEIAEAKAQARAAEANLIKAQQHRDRLEALRKEQFVSQQDLDDAKSDMNAAAANLDAAQQAAELAVKGPRKEDIESAREQLKAYEAALRLAQRELHDTRLYAPTNGIIQNRILEPGDMASASVPVFSLALQDPVWVRAYIPEPDLGRIHAGMSATIQTDSYPGKQYEGWIGYISPTAEFTPKQVETPDLRSRLVYQVRVFARNPDNELRLGMPATIHIVPKNDSPATPSAQPAKD